MRVPTSSAWRRSGRRVIATRRPSWRNSSGSCRRSDEIRLLTGRRAPVVPGAAFLDVWETAGDGSAGHTMAKANPNAAPLLLPDLRWDYIFVSWPSGPGGIGHPLTASLVGRDAHDGV